MTFNELLFMWHQLSRNQHQKVTALVVRFTALPTFQRGEKFNPQGIFLSTFYWCIFRSLLLTPRRAQPKERGFAARTYCPCQPMK
jgi:hypothetical protein